jgi:hypothetical protein
VAGYTEQHVTVAEPTDLQPPAHKPTGRPVRTWIVIETVLVVPAVVIGAVMALMSVMMFDAPGSEHNKALILLFSSMVAFPLACIVGVALGWIAIARHRDRGAMWFSLLPLLPITTGIAGIIWLQIASGGRFAG